MIKNYHKLKECCKTTYRIDKKLLEVGKLSDVQLDTAEKILSKWKDLRPDQIKQLNSVRYVKNYRAEVAKKILLENANNKRLEKVTKIANGISVWDERLINKIIKDTKQV